jgi:hypothetical protein
VRFDPEPYTDYLTRLRYEAAWWWAVDRHEAGTLPSHLFDPSAQAEVAAFDSLRVEVSRPERWREIAASMSDPFLIRWANHLTGQMVMQAAARSAAFAEAWSQCRAQTVTLQGMVTAGREWGAVWRSLRAAAQQARESFADVARDDPSLDAKFTYLEDLERALVAQHPLSVARVTVRLDQARLPDATVIQLELRTPERGGIWTSEPFLAGPSAPAGSGWVGTTALAWEVPLSALHELSGRVVTAAGQQTLLEVSYGSLAEGMGPAALARQTGGPEGSLGFRVDLEAYWGGLDLPDPGLVF